MLRRDSSGVQITGKDVPLPDDIGIQIGPRAIGVAVVGNQFDFVQRAQRVGQDYFQQKGNLEVIMTVTCEPVSTPNVTSSNPNWQGVFPDADHRWVMGVRRGDAADFFSPRDPTGQVRAERERWLTEDPENYAALTPTAEPALADTVALARQLGVTLDPTLSPWEQLMALGRAWEADFVWMHPDETGAHRLTGGRRQRRRTTPTAAPLRRH